MSCGPDQRALELAVLKISNDGSVQEDCERSFLVRNVLSQGEQRIPLIRHKNQCMVHLTLSYENETAFTTAGLDTGAQLSCMSRKRLSTLFPQGRFQFEAVQVLLKSAGDQKIECHGALSMKCELGNCVRIIKFFIISGTDQILIGYPDICAFNLVLNTSLKSCTVNNITLSFNEPINEVMLFQPKYNYAIKPGKVQYITLKAVPKKNATFNNCQVDIYFCDCCLNGKNTLCSFCLESKPLYTCFLTTLEVTIPLKTYHTSVGRRDSFQGVRWVEKAEGKDEIVTVDQEDPRLHMVNCDNLMWDESLADPASYCLERGHLYLEAPSILGSNPGLREVKENPNTYAINLTNENTAQKCAFCTAANTEFFCDVTDPRCDTYRTFKEKILGPEQAICDLIEVSVLTPELTVTEVVFLQILHIEELYDTLNLRCVASKIDQFKEKLLSSGANSDFYWIQEQNHCLYVCLFKRYLYFDHLSLLNKIMLKCQQDKLECLTFINFHYLLMSERSLTSVFQHCKIKLYLLKYKESKINMIQEKDKGFILETADRDAAVDKLKISDKGKERLKQVFREVSESENGLHSVFAKNSLDVSYFSSKISPHVPFIFDFQWKPEAATYVPIRERVRYVNPNIRENVREIITKLREVGVVYSGFSPLNAQSVFCSKRIDQTLEEFVSLGGNPDHFVPGTASTRSFGLRHCIDFWQINNLMYTAPLNQQPPYDQLKSIATNVKYISSFDACSMYYSLKLSKDSSRWTGFNSGLTDMSLSDLCYGSSPMGAANSVIFQNCALTHTLEGVPDTRIWADNILVVSDEEDKHIETVACVLHRLRQHGLKIKFSKVVLCAQDKIAIYGFTLSLTEKKLFVNKDKLQALKMKERPKTVTELKSLLGSFAFFRKFLGFVQKSITILSEMTRRGRFFWNEERNRAYEDLLSLLSHPELIFVHRADYSRPVFGVTDSSLNLCSYIIYQEDDKGRPKVLEYDTRVLPERQQSYPPLLCELFGVISLVSTLQEEFSYHGPGVTVYTDSKPIILICSAAHFNARLARIRIFLNSLTWLKIDYKKGKSEVISACDYFTRSSDFKKTYSQKLPKEEDIQKVKKVSQKLSEDQVLSVAESFFVMDYLLNKDETDLEMLEDNSCLMQDNEIVFKIMGKEEPVRGPKMGPNQAPKSTQGPKGSGQGPDLGVNQVVTRSQSQALRERRSQSQVMRNMLMEQEQPEEEEHPNMFRCLVPLHQGDRPLEMPQMDPVTGNKIKQTGFQGFFQHFLKNIFLLDKEAFVLSQFNDPSFRPIIEECRAKGEAVRGEKVYFLYENILFCKKDLHGVNIYRVCLAGTSAYDLLNLLHKQRGHIRASKLLNLAQMHFDFRHGDKLADIIVKDCWQCVTNSPITNKKRCDLPKNPILLSAPRKAIAVDEMLVYQSRGVCCKILNFTCLYSHHLDIRFIRGQLTSDQFLKAVKEIKAGLGSDWEYLVTDGAGNLNSQFVHQACKELDLVKLTTSAYSHRSNICELLNKLLLALARSLAAENACDPDSIEKLVVKSVEILNATNFANSQWLSPHSLYFGAFPKGNLFDNLDLDGQMFKNKESYLKATLLLQKFMRDLRSGYLRKRAENTAAKASKDHNQGIKDKVMVGDHVTIINQHRETGGWKKIFSNYQGTFQVVGKTDSLLYVVPVVKMGEEARQVGQGPGRRLVVIKVDKQFIRKVTPAVTLDPNYNYFSRWGETNYAPRPLFYTDQVIDTFYKVHNIKEPCNVIGTLQKYLDLDLPQNPGKSALLTFQQSQKIYMIKGLRRRPRVNWKENVEIITFKNVFDIDPIREHRPLETGQKKLVRHFRKGSKYYSCDCKYCLVSREHCYISHCDKCREITPSLER